MIYTLRNDRLSDISFRIRNETSVVLCKPSYLRSEIFQVQKSGDFFKKTTDENENSDSNRFFLSIHNDIVYYSVLYVLGIFHSAAPREISSDIPLGWRLVVYLYI